MKQIPLTRGKFTLVDDEDFEWLNQWKWYCSTSDYVVRALPNKDHSKRGKLYMQRVIMNPPKNMQVDHVNRNKLDNRKSNLRICTGFENRLNRTTQKNSKIGHKDIGIQPVVCNGKLYKYFFVRIQINGKRFRWYRKNLKEAILLRNKKIKELHGNFSTI